VSDRPLPELVEVEWRDAAVVADVWTDIGEAEDNARKSYGNLIRTAGYLVVDSDEYLVVVASLNRLADDVGGGMMIPRSAVESVRHLGEGEVACST
jgi:hypothetical protein